MLQSSNFLFRLDETVRSEMEAIRRRPAGFPMRSGTPCRTRSCSPRRRAANWPRRRASRRPRGACSIDPRAREALDEFVSQWLRFDRILTASKDRRKYPAVHARDSRRDDRGGAHVCRRPGLERSELHGSVHRQLRLRERRPGADLQSAGSRERVRTGAVSGRFRTRRAARPGAVPGADGQAGGFVSHGARPVRARTVSLPARARSAARREHQPAAGHRGEAADQSRPHVGACHQSELRHLPQADRPDRLRAREVRCGGREARQVHAAVLQRTRGEGGGRRTPPKTIDLDIDAKGYVAGIPNSQFSSPTELGAVLAKSAAVPGMHREAVLPLYGRAAWKRPPTVR